MLPAMLRPEHSKTMRRTKRKSQVYKLWWIARICVQRMLLLSKRSCWSDTEKTRYQVLSSCKETNRNVTTKRNCLSDEHKCFRCWSTQQNPFNHQYNVLQWSINYVSISASRIFGDKRGQKVHDSIKEANNIFTNFPMQKISTNSHQFSQHE